MIKNTLEENLISSVICFTLHIAAHRKSCRQHTCCFIHLWYCYVLIFCHNSNTIPNDGNLNTTGCVGYAPKTLSATKSKRYQQSKRIHLFWLANWNYLDSYLFEKKRKTKANKKTNKNKIKIKCKAKSITLAKNKTCRKTLKEHQIMCMFNIPNLKRYKTAIQTSNMILLWRYDRDLFTIFIILHR